MMCMGGGGILSQSLLYHIEHIRCKLYRPTEQLCSKLGGGGNHYYTVTLTNQAPESPGEGRGGEAGSCSRRGHSSKP